MKNLNAFLNPVKKLENKEIVISDRYIDEDGKPIKMVIKPLSPKEIDTIQSDCTKMKGKAGHKQPVMDTNQFNRELVIQSLVYPNLNDVELQDGYGVKCAEDLIDVMFNSGEYYGLIQEITDLNGMNNNINDEIEDAKN